MGFLARVFQPSTLRILVWPDASSAQNNMAAVSADGSTVCVLILRLNSSCSRSIAFVVRTLRHWLGGRPVKVNFPSKTLRLPVRLRHPGQNDHRRGHERVAVWAAMLGALHRLAVAAIQNGLRRHSALPHAVPPTSHCPASS